jgi:hypothetical protein
MQTMERTGFSFSEVGRQPRPRKAAAARRALLGGLLAVPLLVSTQLSGVAHADAMSQATPALRATTPELRATTPDLRAAAPDFRAAAPDLRAGAQ